MGNLWIVRIKFCFTQIKQNDLDHAYPLLHPCEGEMRLKWHRACISIATSMWGRNELVVLVRDVSMAIEVNTSHAWHRSVADPRGASGAAAPVRVILICIYCRKNMISPLIFDICSKSLLISPPKVLILAPLMASMLKFAICAKTTSINKHKCFKLS